MLVVPDACRKRLTECPRVTAGCTGLEAALLGFAVTAQATAVMAPVCAVELGVSWGLHFM